MDIESKKASLRHATNFFRVRLCAAVATGSQRNPRYCEPGLAAPY